MTRQPDRRRGRPRRTGEGSTAVGSWMPDSMVDRLIQLANKHDVSVSEMVKRIVASRIGKPNG